MREASRELLASREDVWRFLAEPYHLADWWPGITGVVPDRRGFASGARWEVARTEGRLSGFGWSGSRVPATLLVGEVSLYEQWSWRLVSRGRSIKAFGPIEAAIRLKWVDPGRTLVTVSVDAPDSFSRLLWASRHERTARTAVNRLYDLVQTAATL
ncbi:MAG TPA: SRPBCC family protein [Gaiellaceae bacterium]|nr:SRPBCC family protein [Gaiellaceae bacterium]